MGGAIWLAVDTINQIGSAQLELEALELRDYGFAAQQRLIYVSVGVFIIAITVLLWVARRSFLAPLETLLATSSKKATRTADLAHIGTLAASLAHEIRNPITAMKARNFALRELIGSGAAAHDQSTVIEEELNRLERIVQDFLDFARPSKPELERQSLEGFLSKVADDLEPELKELGISLSLDIADEKLSAMIDANHMEQVLSNLVRNAAESCPSEGGIVNLTCRAIEGRTRISVADNGAGIPPEYRDSIFTPFFSKKPGGTGLGLSISRNIVRKHGGDLTFETEEGKGTVFHIDLNSAP
jgi:signal transduction histidine kinase